MKKIIQPMSISVLLENVSDKRSVWLNLPASKKRFAAVLERIGAENGNFIITDYTHWVLGLYKNELMRTPLAVVNFLASRLKTLYEDDILKLCAIWDTDHWFDTVAKLINYTYETYKYKLMPGIRDAEMLGNLHLGKPDRSILSVKHGSFVDRYAYGVKLAELEKGVFTPHGYITSKDRWKTRDHTIMDAKWRVPSYLNLKGTIGEDLYGTWDEHDQSI